MCDLLSRVIECLQEVQPSLTDEMALQIEKQIRGEFAGEMTYIAKTIPERDRLKDEVRRLFNGRNATEVARELKIGRTTVYRILKTAGR